MKIVESRPSGRNTAIARLSAALVRGKNGKADVLGRSRDMAPFIGIPKPEFKSDLPEPSCSLQEQVEKLRRQLEQSRQRIIELEKLAAEDAMVPVRNRRAFVSDLARMLSFAQRYGGAVSVLYFDIDDMKSINDTHGHSAGDAAIVHVADQLASNIRESDIVGRLGGDEFGIIMANAPKSEAVIKAVQLSRKISTTPFQWKGKDITVSISFGAYALQGDEDAAAMLDYADQAMYAQKSAARITG